MTKICGYNCEHNKGGICQITYCDKIGKITTTTQEIEVLTRWQDPTIKEKDKEIERLKSEIDEMKIQEERKEMHNHSKNVRIEYLNNEIKKLKNTIDEALKELEKIGDFYTTPAGEVIHLKDKILHINNAINKLKEGKE